MKERTKESRLCDNDDEPERSSLLIWVKCESEWDENMSVLSFVFGLHKKEKQVVLPTVKKTRSGYRRSSEGCGEELC